MGSKIKRFGLEFAEKSKFEIEIEFDRENDWKTEIKTKLNLIYDSKYKSNAKWWKIRMKIHNLTQSRTQNDPINPRIHGFAFHDSKSENWHWRCDFSRFIRWNSDFLYSSDAEMSQKALKIKRFSDCGVYTIQFARKPKNSFPSRRTFLFIREIGRNCRMRQFDAISSWD